MPIKYRDDINACCGGKMIITVDLDLCLLLYPFEEWLVAEKEIADLPSLDKRARALKRILIGYASDINMDKGGRLLIPGPLREFVEMDKEVSMIGQGSKFEIWDEVRWKKNANMCIEANIKQDDLIGDLRSLSY